MVCIDQNDVDIVILRYCETIDLPVTISLLSGVKRLHDHASSDGWAMNKAKFVCFFFLRTRNPMN